jgi:hypothetical protein
MHWNIKTSSTICTARPEAVTSRFESWAARSLVRLQIVTANLDPEILQWPRGKPDCTASLALRDGTIVLVGWHSGSAASSRSSSRFDGIARHSRWQTRQSLDQLISDHLRFTCHAIYVLPGSTAMTILVPGPGEIEPAESPMSEISRLLTKRTREVRDTLHRGRWRSSS